MLKKHLKKSWSKSYDQKLYKNNDFNDKFEKKQYIVCFACIEMLSFYKEIWSIDEFFIWNNEKNSGIYSWFDRNGNDNYIHSEVDN